MSVGRNLTESCRVTREWSAHQVRVVLSLESVAKTGHGVALLDVVESPGAELCPYSENHRGLGRMSMSNGV